MALRKICCPYRNLGPLSSFGVKLFGVRVMGDIIPHDSQAGEGPALPPSAVISNVSLIWLVLMGALAATLFLVFGTGTGLSIRSVDPSARPIAEQPMGPNAGT